MSARTSVAARVTTALRHPVVIVGLLAVALQLVFRGWALSSSWFYTDDYLRLREALEARMSLEYLLTPENGHLMPGTRAIYYFFAHGPGLDWGVAAAVALAFQALASLAALWMLVILFGPRWEVLPGLIVYLTTAMTAQASLWWISALNQTPVQMCFFLAVGCWVSHLRSGRHLPLWGLLATLAWGLLFFQKTLFVLPVLVLLALAYFARGGPAQRMLTIVRRYWLSAVLVGSLAAGFSGYYLVSVPASGSAQADPPWTRITTTMLETFVAGIAGGPWRWQDRPGGAWADPPTWFVLTASAVLLATVVGSLLLRRRAGRAWLLLGLYYVMLIGTIGVTRAAVFGAEIGSAYRLQTDGVCAAVLALTLAWVPLNGAVEQVEHRRRKGRSAPRARLPGLAQRAPTALVVVMTVLVALAGTVSWLRYVESWSRVNDGRTFVQQVGKESDRLPGIEVADRPVPSAVLDDFTRPDNQLSDIAELIAPGLTFPDQSPRLTAVTDEGTVNQALIEPQARTKPGPVPNCGWSVHRGEQVRVPLEAEALGSAWVRIGYFVQDPGTVTLELGGRTLTTAIGSGPNSLYVRVTEDVDGVRFRGVTSGGALCVNVVEVGRTVPGPRL